MRRVYLFVYSDLMGDRDTMRGLVDSIPQILDWCYDIPNSFYIISERSANELSDLIRSNYSGTHIRFIITEISNNRQGYLPKKTWEFIKSVNSLLSEEMLP